MTTAAAAANLEFVIEDPHFTPQMRLRSRSFDAWALEYDRYRPTYPQAVFDHVAARLSLPADARVADLGSGTGKAARQMARRGWHVTAVEPGEGMLEVLRSRAAAEELAIEAVLASAEETGLPSASFDLATAAQAFHWFDKPRAVAEMARIVRPGGGAAIFWNARADDRSEFLLQFTEVTARFLAPEHVDRRSRELDVPPTLAVSEAFEVDDQRVEIAHQVEMDVEDFLALMLTSSQMRLFVDAESREQLNDEVRALAAEHFGGGRLTVDYDVDLYVARRR